MPLKTATDKGENYRLNQTVLCCLVIMQHTSTFTVLNWCISGEYISLQMNPLYTKNNAKKIILYEPFMFNKD